MTWTYDTTLTADKDQVRFLVQDTEVTDQLVANEEIVFALTEEGGVSAAAALIAESLAARFAREVTKSVDGLSLSFSDRSQAYVQLAQRLRRQVALEVAPYAGGITKSDKQSNEVDTDIVSPIFTRHLGEESGLDSTRLGLRSDV